ncbi:HEAT repeat domain-containing protein [Actinoplanes aureus]|uniref:HEAT repeat domain-containing protein n=1 Tax=Actinoplanes aureus TaxID=2792083 RepID=A0A931G1P6_9ACTN|nr:HEAT repeat domain-containing protein [Actinoplanes aureus]MBG0567255.1 HEAT repeat domain-containing protein [Actinoplanes aureus]
MLAGLDDIDWAAYDGAYGPATEAPDILRAIADPDPEVAGDGRFDFHSAIWHQGTVYPVTVAAVPFLIELATTPGVHRRDMLLHTVGVLGDPGQSYGDDLPAVRAALAAHSDTLLPQLADPDPGVREAAAFALAHSGPQRLSLVQPEPDPRVRASLLMAVALHDGAGAVELLREAATTEPFPVPVAAALGYARAGLPIPPEVLGHVARDLGADEEWQSPWSSDPLGEILALAGSATVDTLTARLIAGGGSQSRIRLTHALTRRFMERRGAPVALLPRLRELLADHDEKVRAAAVDTAAQAGTAAAGVAGELARIADAGDWAESGGPANTALSTLVRLGDPRWRPVLLAAWESGYDPDAVGLLFEHPPAFDPEMLAAVRRRLAAQSAAGLTGNPVISLVNVLRGWGAAASAAVPEIVAALPAARMAAVAALGRIGPGAASAVDALRDGMGGIETGYALWRITGDPGPLVAAARTALSRGPAGRYAWDLRMLAEAGPAAAPLVPLLRAVLTDTAPETYPDRDARIAAARVLWRATGEVPGVLPTVDAVLRAGGVPVRTAATLAADLAPAGTELLPALREALRNRWATLDVARALWRYGTDPAELIDPLLAAAADPHGDQGAIGLLVEMRATPALPRLRELAEGDERVVRAGSYQDIVWLDDRLRRDAHAAVVALS